MNDSITSIIYFILAVANYGVYIMWLLRCDLEYIEKHKFPPEVSFILGGICLFNAISLLLAF